MGDLNRYFIREDMHVSKKHMKKCSAALMAGEMQIKTVIRFRPTDSDLTPVRISTLKNLQKNKCGEGMKKMEPSCTVGGNVN